MSDDRALIGEALAGRRIKTEFSLFDAETADARNCRHWWRVIACDGSAVDVVECSRCGKQRTTGCDFDEDMS